MNSDNPISRSNEDLLNRQQFAERIACLINNHKNKESVVIGIEGEWGSGKTSFINMVLESLENSFVVKFNPWNFSGQNELIKDFFDSLASSLKSDSDKQNETLNKVKQYASKLIKKAEFNVNPKVSFLGFELSLGDQLKLGTEKTIAEQKEEINKLLVGLEKKIIVVIDDIDRLDKEETKLIFKMVKITANFENTVFLLAYDRGKVCDRLKDEGSDGEEYLKKIIQVSFDLPKVEDGDLYRILSNRLDKVIVKFDQKLWDDTRWGNLFHAGFKKFFSNIRDINCFNNTLSLDLEIITPEEVNPVDFIGTECLRVFAPKLFAFIADNKDLFIGHSDSHSQEMSERKILIDAEINKLPDDLKEPARKVIKQLFPQVGGLYSNTHYGSDWDGEWRKQLRPCCDENFGKYFLLKIPSNKISMRTLNEMVELASSDGHAFVHKLAEMQKTNKLRNLMWKFIDKIADINKDQKTQILLQVSDFAMLVEDKKQGVFDLETIDIQVMRLGYQFVKSLPSEDRVGFLEQYLTETKNLYSAVHLASVFEDELTKYEEKKSIDEPILSKEDVEKVMKLVMDRTKKSAEDGNLHKNYTPLALFYHLKNHGEQEVLDRYISNLIRTKVGFFLFLELFKYESMSQSVSDYVPKRHTKFNIKALPDFLNQDEVNSRISKYKKLTVSQQAIVDLYNKATKSKGSLFED